ncbi:MAG: ROK family protein [Candidatus Woesearchaeota archaeon]
MKNYIGIDVGGTKVDLVLADEEGNILFSEKYDSPFLETGNRLADEETDAEITGSEGKEVLLDKFKSGIGMGIRFHKYLEGAVVDFRKKARNKRKLKGTIDGIGASLCGTVRKDESGFYFLGANTPNRFVNNRLGIQVSQLETLAEIPFAAANDGNAAAKAQGIFYKARLGLDPKKTGYAILGTGFGFGVPDTDAQTELGHIPIGFVHSTLMQKCGCTDGRIYTRCAENYASGGGMERIVRDVSALSNLDLQELAQYERLGYRAEDLKEAIRGSELNYMPDGEKITTAKIMSVAYNGDAFAEWVVNLAAQTTAYALVSAAQMFGLERIGVGESVAINNPWHVENIAEIVEDMVKDNKLLPNGLKVEMTPISENAAKYGALSLVVPEDRYDMWADAMAQPD